MASFEFRWRNFRCFEDTGWRKIKPLTILIGPNNSGKTSILLPFLLMKQSIESLDLDIPLKINGDYINLGNYKQFVNDSDEEKRITFEFRFPDIDVKKNGKTSEESPHQIKLIFKKGTEKKQIRLDEFIVYDKENKKLIQFKLRRDNYYIKYYKFINDLESKDELSSPDPNNFLFFPEQSILEFIEKSGLKAFKDIFPKGFAKYISTLMISKDVQDILERMDFIGPLRELPDRLYRLSGDRPKSVGPTGKKTPEILWYLQHTKQEEIIKEKLETIFGIRFRIRPIGGKAPQAFRFEIKDTHGPRWFDFTDVGFGYSQILPIIVQGLKLKKGEILICEQPEIHLNPSIQGKLGDFFAYLTEKEDKNVIIETHSEHILLRIRTLIAEKKLDHSKVGLYFVERKQGISRLKEIEIEKSGLIKDESWPVGFFDDTVTESLRLAAAQRNSYLENKNISEKEC